jgi:hypothetical protein
MLLALFKTGSIPWLCKEAKFNALTRNAEMGLFTTPST